MPTGGDIVCAVYLLSESVLHQPPFLMRILSRKNLALSAGTVLCARRLHLLTPEQCIEAHGAPGRSQHLQPDNVIPWHRSMVTGVLRMKRPQRNSFTYEAKSLVSCRVDCTLPPESRLFASAALRTAPGAMTASDPAESLAPPVSLLRSAALLDGGLSSRSFAQRTCPSQRGLTCDGPQAPDCHGGLGACVVPVAIY
jgi:hypothetical protein